MSNKVLTTATGAPVSDNQNSLTAGPRGPIVFEDFHLFEKLATFNRERIPERVVLAIPRPSCLTRSARPRPCFYDSPPSVARWVLRIRSVIHAALQ